MEGEGGRGEEGGAGLSVVALVKHWEEQSVVGKGPSAKGLHPLEAAPVEQKKKRPLGQGMEPVHWAMVEGEGGGG